MMSMTSSQTINKKQEIYVHKEDKAGPEDTAGGVWRASLACLRSWTQSPVRSRMSSHNTCELSINLSKTDFFVLFLKLFYKSEII